MSDGKFWLLPQNEIAFYSLSKVSDHQDRYIKSILEENVNDPR